MHILYERQPQEGRNASMKYEMGKERGFLFSPTAAMANIVTIRGSVPPERLKRAVDTAVRANGLLSTKILIDETGKGFYKEQEEPVYSITVTGDTVEEVLAREQAIPFRLEEGELIRFFILIGHKVKLLVYSHLLAGDHLSIAFFIQDVMTVLSGGKIFYKSIFARRGDGETASFFAQKDDRLGVKPPF